jgi:hypothetical protein
MTELEGEIAAGLSKFADYPLARMTPETRVWHDAKLAGDDFCDFVEWFSKRFNASLPGRALDYAPGEPNIFTWPFARQRTYQPLTIGNLATLAKDANQQA